jgi:uncharacterized protein (DUF486 family)
MKALPFAVQTFGLLALSNVFMTCAVLYMQQPFKAHYLWAALCPVGAVYFTFRS